MGTLPSLKSSDLEDTNQHIRAIWMRSTCHFNGTILSNMQQFRAQWSENPFFRSPTAPRFQVGTACC